MSNMIILLLLLLIVFSLKSNQEFQNFQQFGYYSRQYIDWKKGKRTHPEDLLFYLSLILYGTTQVIPDSTLSTILRVICLVLLTIYAYFKWLIVRAYPAKKKLVYTHRIQRMVATESIILFAIFILAAWLNVILLIPVYLFLDLFIVASNGINIPIERHINERYYKEARHILQSAPFLQSIGITGSYGKTSTKHIIYHMLANHFNTLMSPASYNTKLGLTRTIRSDLRPVTEVFVAEMGSKQYGEIGEMCAFIQPKVGLVTSIGPQHLETFGSLENIIKEKTSLLDAIPIGGIIFINEEDPHLRQYKVKPGVRRISYGTHHTSDFYITDYHTSPTGSKCTIIIKETGESIQVQTKLLGMHNMINILAGCAVAVTLGVSPDEIPTLVSGIEPIKNRLSMREEKGVLILEDAFNSNPVGAKMALDVLGEFTGGKKIIMTPGMIELGTDEKMTHRKFGRQISTVCDYVILISESQTKYIKEGLELSNYPAEQMVTVHSMARAFDVMRSIAVAGDIVLIENDVPDTFEENA